MKQLYFLMILFLSFPFYGNAQVELPVGFEDVNLSYDFVGFEGADSALDGNPDASGENTSATVLRSIKTNGAQFFAGTFLNLDTPIDFLSSTGISIQTYSPKANIPVRLAIENQTTGNQIFVDVNTTVMNAWETLTFDFAGLIDPAIDYNRVVVFFEFIVDLPGDGSTYYFDNIETANADGGGGGDSVELPVDFEDDATLMYDFLGFEGADSALEANPDASGENMSATVLRTIKTEGAQFFAGTFLNLDTPIDFSMLTGISVNTYSPKADIPVRLAIENQTTGNQIFVDVNTTLENAWETLTFDFTSLIDPAIDYNRIVIFFEFIDGLAGDGSTYYFDNIENTSADGGGGGDDPVELPVNFEDDATLMYDFLGFEGADSALEANPDASGENTSATVLRTIKTDGAQFFAGTFLNLDTPINFSDGFEGISINTYSPKADIPVRVRLENADNSSGIELDVNTTVENTWETLLYDFSSLVNPDVDYVRIVIFFEFVVDLPGDGSTYYFDNIELAETDGGGGNDPVTLPLTFEEENLVFDFLGFEGADSAIEGNPDASGENTSATVMRTIKTEGAQFFAGTFINLDEPIDFTTSNVILMDSYSPKANIPVRLRLENADNSSGVELDATTTVENSWETLAYDLTGLLDSSVDYVRVVVFFEFVVDLPGDGSTYYFDNVGVDGTFAADEFSSINVSVFPNPSIDHWTVTTNSDIITEISVYDLLGKKIIKEEPNTTRFDIQASNLKTGIYITTIKTVQGQETIKLIKQ